MTWTQPEIDRTLRSVVERSLTDQAFRELAVRDARAAIAQIIPTPIPPDFRIQCIDNAGFDLTVVLPDAPQSNAGELRDEEVAGVAGGTIGGIGTVITAYCVGFTQNCVTANQLTACNPLYTKKPNSPALCPH
jgi:hypothetical protein